MPQHLVRGGTGTQQCSIVGDLYKPAMLAAATCVVRRRLPVARSR
jgi:hypothetical protein